MMNPSRCLLSLAAVLFVPWTAAAEISLLSGGAVEPGIEPAVAAFEATTGHRVKLTFHTAPEIGRRLGAGEAWDLVVAPVAVLDGAAKAGRVGAERAVVGRVGIGVAVHPDAPMPAIGDAESLKRSVLGADAVVYNRASTGIAFEGVLRRLEIAAQVEPKAVRPADGAAVMERLLAGHGNELGFGAITEILLFRDRGLKYAGPLPSALQTYTVYAAALPTGSGQAEAARQLLAYLGRPEAQALFVKAGIDPAP